MRLFGNLTAYLALALANAALPGVCRAATHACPWLSEGSAAAVLGGAVDVHVEEGEQQEGICRFVGQDPMHAGELQLTVVHMLHPAAEFATLLAQCQNKMPLMSIGNEAYACAIHPGQQVLGRVRDSAFQIRLAPAAADEASAHEKLVHIAEQVAGNLF